MEPLPLFDCRDTPPVSEPPGDDGGGSRARGQAPLFETFWQGRLIPGSGLDSLPLVEAVRTKMRASTSGKDYLPDEVFGRLRCVRRAAAPLTTHRGPCRVPYRLSHIYNAPIHPAVLCLHDIPLQ